jgi:hypothetical protein
MNEICFFGSLSSEKEHFGLQECAKESEGVLGIPAIQNEMTKIS